MNYDPIYGRERKRTKMLRPHFKLPSPQSLYHPPTRSAIPSPLPTIIPPPFPYITPTLPAPPAHHIHHPSPTSYPISNLLSITSYPQPLTHNLLPLHLPPSPNPITSPPTTPPSPRPRPRQPRPRTQRPGLVNYQPQPPYAGTSCHPSRRGARRRSGRLQVQGP
jgi:hypothetical protein